MCVIRGRTLRMVALFSVATLLSVGLVIFGTASPAHADPGCNPGGAYLLWVRGSGQGFDDVEARRFREHMRYALNAAGVPAPEWAWAELGNLDGDYFLEHNEYPAVSAPWNTAPWIYGPSVEKGTNELVAHLYDRYAGDGPTNTGPCLTETAIIGGYSQGGDVVGWALERSGYGALSSRARSHIGFAALYGDPRNNYSCSLNRWWQRGINANGCNHAGVLGARSPYAPDDFRMRFGSWCDTYDGICTSGSSGVSIGNHTTIYRDWWIWQSAAEIANAASNRLALLNPTQGSGVGNATYLGTDTLYPDRPMFKNQYIMSPDGHFVLILQLDGNLVLYGPRYRPIWHSGTTGNVGSVILQGDGNLVIYSPTGQAVWQNQTKGSGSNRLTVQTDGNLVQYNHANLAVWHTATNRPVPYILHAGTDRLNAGQSLGLGYYLRSADGTRFLLLQGDGNLVLYGPGQHLLWHSGTRGLGASFAGMQPDGNLVLYTPNKVARWHTNTQGSGATFLALQSDGNLVVYTPSITSVWWSGTAGFI